MNTPRPDSTEIHRPAVPPAALRAAPFRRARPVGLAWAGVALITLALVPQRAAAQGETAPAGRPGEELRVTWLDRFATSATFPLIRREEVTLVSFDETQLVGRVDDGLLVLDTRMIRSVRRRVGTKPASAPAMVAGSAGGFAAAFLLGALAADRAAGRSAVDAGLTTGVLIGAPLGAVIAWIASRSRGIYEDVPPQPREAFRATAVVAPSGAVGLAIAVPSR